MRQHSHSMKPLASQHFLFCLDKISGEQGLNRPFRGNLERPLFLWSTGAAGCALRQENPLTNPQDAAREPIFMIAPAVMAIIAILTIIHAVRVFLLDPAADNEFVSTLAFNPARFGAGLDLFVVASPFTYSLLHGDWVHLSVNVIWLAAFGSPLAWRIGTLRFAAFWAVTAAAGALVHALAPGSENAWLIGASGSVSGMVGAAARLGFAVDRKARPPAFSAPLLSAMDAIKRREVLQFVALWAIINLVTGTGLLSGADSPAIAWQAHAGGFAAGFLGMALFDRPARRP